MINTYVPLPNLAPGEHTIEVKYVDERENERPLHAQVFDTRTNSLKNGKDAIIRTASLINFSRTDNEFRAFFIRILFHGPIIKEIRYSINSDKLDQSFPFEPITKVQEMPKKVYTVIPNDTQFVCVQITFTDGTRSPVQKCVPEPGD